MLSEKNSESSPTFMLTREPHERIYKKKRVRESQKEIYNVISNRNKVTACCNEASKEIERTSGKFD